MYINPHQKNGDFSNSWNIHLVMKKLFLSLSTDYFPSLLMAKRLFSYEKEVIFLFITNEWVN